MGWLDEPGLAPEINTDDENRSGHNVAGNPFFKAGAEHVYKTSPLAKNTVGPSLDDPREVAARIQAAQIQNPQAPNRIADIAGPQQSDLRSYQVNLMNQLAQRAQGQGPSIAEMQMRQAQEAALAQQRANLASQRGSANPLAARSAMANLAQQNQAIASQAAQLRAQEQQAAQNQLAGVAQTARQADEQLALAQYKGSLDRALQQGQLDQNTYDQLAQNARQQAEMQQNINMLPLQASMLANQQAMAKQEARDKRMAGGLQGASSVLSFMSDMNAKKNIKPADEKLTNFLDAIKPYSYNYKNPNHGKGEHVSPMAQDLEKTEIGKHLIVPTNEGKMVDYGKALPSMLAAMGHLNSRIKKLEGK